MDFKNLEFQNKFLYILIVVYCLSLAYSEALKNLAAYSMIFYFLFNTIIGKVKISLDIVNLSILFHLGVVSMGIWVGINFQESLNQYTDILRIVLIFLFFREIDLHFLSYEKIIQLLFIGFSIAALGAFYLFFSNVLSRIELHSVGSINRSAVYMTYIFVTALCLKNQYKNALSKYLFPFVLILSGISIVIGASRMALFSLPIIILLYGFFANKINLTTTLFTSLFVSLATTIVFLFFPDSLVANKIILGFEDTSRIQIWVSSLYAWLENNMFFGIGVGNSIFIDVANYFDTDALTRNIDNAHNIYLDMLLERGLLGLTSFLIFISTFIFTKSNDNFSIFVRLLAISLLLLGVANITFRYEFALLFVTLLGAYLNSSIKKIS